MLHYSVYLENYWEAQKDEFSFVDYEKHFSEEKPCNIYLIGIRPRVRINPNYIKVIDEELIELEFKIQKEDEFEIVIGKLPTNRKINGNVKIESDYPHSRFRLKDEDGYLLNDLYFGQKIDDVNIKSFYALRNCNDQGINKEYNNLDVLYIGKSLRMDKKVSPKIRLQVHHKLQKILERCNESYIDKEVYIILCSFVNKVNMIATTEELKKIGNGNAILDKLENDNSRLKNGISLLTTVSEAALIDYFNTREYNSTFIGSFGKNTHSYYGNIKDSNISRIVLEVDLSGLCRTFNSETPAKFYHKVDYFPSDGFRKEKEEKDFDEIEKEINSFKADE